MNPILFAPVRLGLMLVAATQATAAEPLAWNWAVGDEQRYLLSHEVVLSTDAGESGSVGSRLSQSTLMTWSVQSVAPNGDAVLACTTERVVMRLEDGVQREFIYDSDSQEPPTGLATLIGPVFDAMVAEPFTFTMRPNGEVTDLQVQDELAKVIDRSPAGSLTPDRLLRGIEQALVVFPDGPIDPGQEWQRQSTDADQPAAPLVVATTARYVGPQSDEQPGVESFDVRQQVSAAAESSQEVEYTTRLSEGRLLFARETGRLMQSLRKLVVEAKVSEPFESTSVIEQTTSLQAIEPGEDPLPASDTESAPEE